MTGIVQLGPSSVGVTVDFMRRKAPELARDIVCRLDGAANLAASYGLSPTQWEIVRQWPAFVQMVKEANEDLGGSAGTLERARRKAALAVAELVVADMATIAGNPKSHDRDRIDAAELLVEIGGVSVKAQQAAGAGGAAMAFGGALIQIIMPNGNDISIGSVDPIAPLAPALEGESERVG